MNPMKDQSAQAHCLGPQGPQVLLQLQGHGAIPAPCLKGSRGALGFEEQPKSRGLDGRVGLLSHLEGPGTPKTKTGSCRDDMGSL